MKEGSVVTPIVDFKNNNDEYVTHGISCSPRWPVPGEEYIVDEVVVCRYGEPGLLIVGVKMICTQGAARAILAFNPDSWRELSPPLDVQAIVDEAVQEPA